MTSIDSCVVGVAVELTHAHAAEAEGGDGEPIVA